MGFVKVQKTKAYFKRYQVKYRRRRECKTDYYARKRLVTQDRTKYNSPKYRFVVRLTNSDVITQIVYSKIVGDVVLCAAYSHELPRYGMSVGLTNYAAAYATGLLLARRLLTKLKLADKYKGSETVTGNDYNVEALDDGPRPFKAFLDVGLRRTTTGGRLFAALKGACDGGLNVPHRETRFVGYDADTQKLNAEVLKKHLFAGHVADYMKSLRESDGEKYSKLFSAYIKAGIKAEDLPSLWGKVHAAIRKDPTHKKAEKKAAPANIKPKAKKLTHAQRKERVKAKLSLKAKMSAKRQGKA